MADGDNCLGHSKQDTKTRELSKSRYIEYIKNVIECRSSRQDM